MHASGRKRFNELFKNANQFKKYSWFHVMSRRKVCSHGTATTSFVWHYFQMRNFFCKHLWFNSFTNHESLDHLSWNSTDTTQYQANVIEISESVYLQYIAACETLFLWYLWPSSSNTLSPRCPQMTCAITIANTIRLNNSIQIFLKVNQLS